MANNTFQNASMEDMVATMIRFLMKWGLWQNTKILACGNSYTTSDRSSDLFMGIPYVEIQQHVALEEFVDTDMLDDEDNLSAYPFGMTFESGLTELFQDHFMEVESETLKDDAWEYIFLNSSFIDEYSENYDGTFKDFLREVLNTEDRAHTYSMWDPLEYESYEEYQGMNEDDGDGIPVYTLFDTYEDYQNGRTDSVKNSPELYEMVKRYIIRFAEENDEITIRGEVAGHILKEFKAIFEKYGLEFEPVYDWMVVGHRKNIQEDGVK